MGKTPEEIIIVQTPMMIQFKQNPGFNYHYGIIGTKDSMSRWDRMSYSNTVLIYFFEFDFK